MSTKTTKRNVVNSPSVNTNIQARNSAQTSKQAASWYGLQLTVKAKQKPQPAKLNGDSF